MIRIQSSPRNKATKIVKKLLGEKTVTQNQHWFRQEQYRAAYTKYLSERDHPLANKKLTELLLRVFKQLPNLKAIELCINNPFIGAKQLGKDFPMLTSFEFNSGGVQYVPIVMEAISKSDLKIEQLEFTSAPGHSTALRRRMKFRRSVLLGATFYKMFYPAVESSVTGSVR